MAIAVLQVAMERITGIPSAMMEDPLAFALRRAEEDVATAVRECKTQFWRGFWAGVLPGGMFGALTLLIWIAVCG
jgi:hypothetical protein